MSRVYDDERLATVYQPGNEMPASSLQAWTEFIGVICASAYSRGGRHRGRHGNVLLGSGPMDQRRVIVGVDPSAMLARARQRLVHPMVQYVYGDAAAVPIAGGSSISHCSPGSSITCRIVVAARGN